ncbi:MAG: radical SAM protein [Candidatus Bathyarchaeota archaeon]|nr:MAG: radical SAM protein [Candidatus Bathyarchaeota archaeon]
MRKKNEMVYGPVLSRRFGSSLGINVNFGGGKTCSFDCVYCQYGRTVHLVSSASEYANWERVEPILKAVETQLRRLNMEDRELNSITFSGNGESTLYPYIQEALRGVKKLRNKYYPGVQVGILTNSSMIDCERVFEALMEFDSIVAKLDVGSQETFVGINRPAKRIQSLNEIVNNLIRLQEATDRVTLQTLIFKSTDPCTQPDNAGLEEIKLIAEKACLIDPKEIQIYTVSRHPSESFVEPIKAYYLRETASRINNLIDKKRAFLYL